MKNDLVSKLVFYGALVSLAFYLGTCVGFVRTARCSPLDCEAIRNPDRRNMCRAVTKGDRTFCEFIKDHDLRQECRARTK